MLSWIVSQERVDFLQVHFPLYLPQPPRVEVGYLG